MGITRTFACTVDEIAYERKCNEQHADHANDRGVPSRHTEYHRPWPRVHPTTVPFSDPPNYEGPEADRPDHAEETKKADPVASHVGQIEWTVTDCVEQGKER
jgi:hypothetical protein